MAYMTPGDLRADLEAWSDELARLRRQRTLRVFLLGLLGLCFIGTLSVTLEGALIPWLSYGSALVQALGIAVLAYLLGDSAARIERTTALVDGLTALVAQVEEQDE